MAVPRKAKAEQLATTHMHTRAGRAGGAAKQGGPVATNQHTKQTATHRERQMELLFSEIGNMPLGATWYLDGLARRAACIVEVHKRECHRAVHGQARTGPVAEISPFGTLATRRRKRWRSHCGPAARTPSLTQPRACESTTLSPPVRM
jgi:hypothetical protein